MQCKAVMECNDAIKWCHVLIQYNAMQCNTKQCNIMQCNSMQCSAMEYIKM